MNTIRIRLGHESLDVTLAYLKGKDAASEEAQEHANSSRIGRILTRRNSGWIGPPGRGPYSAAKWGVEGFSEVLSRELAPLGIKVTIIEPGGFRTDFAGSSTKLSEGHPEYDSTVGATARFQRAYNGKQPGDPKKAAQAIVRLTQEQKPPLRLLLGSDAYITGRRRTTLHD